MDPQQIEVIEEMTISLASQEQQNATSDLVVNVRVVWTPSEGIYAEPLSWKLGEAPTYPIGDKFNPSPIDMLCRRATAENFNTRHLDYMLNEPPFTGAMRYVMAENAADRAWDNSRKL